VLLHKEHELFVDTNNGDSVAILVQAPASGMPYKQPVAGSSAVAGFVGWLCDGHTQAKAAQDAAVARALEDGKPAPPPLADDATRVLDDKTLRNVVGPLRACLASAEREGLIRHNPARDVDLPHRPTIDDGEDGDTRALTREQLAAFLRIVHPVTGCSSACSPRPGCGSRRRSRCSGDTSSLTARRRT
jgi:hypothetical protein